MRPNRNEQIEELKTKATLEYIVERQPSWWGKTGCNNTEEKIGVNGVISRIILSSRKTMKKQKWKGKTEMFTPVK